MTQKYTYSSGDRAPPSGGGCGGSNPPRCVKTCRIFRQVFFVVVREMLRRFFRKLAVSEHLNFAAVRRERFLWIFDGRDIRCFQNLWYFHEIRMVYDGSKSLKSDFALTDIGMAVFLCALRIFAVIDMEDSNLVFSENPVKGFDDTVKIIPDVISAVMCVAGVKADTKLFIIGDAAINPGQLFKGAAKL